MLTLKNKFACLADLPSMPTLLMEALQQVNSKHDMTTLVDKISRDPSMAVRILRIVNSPFYGMYREIGSLREAIVLLGINRVRDILVSICFSKMLPIRHKDFNYSLFLHHSMAVAECTRQLASCTNTSPDFAFTAGLLHDIGDLMIVMHFHPDEFSQEQASTLIETKRRLLGFDHMEIGGRAAQHWNLPTAIQEAIEQHETPPQPGAAKSLALLVYTANLLIVKVEQSNEFALEVHDPICTALARLNVSIDQATHCTDSGRQFADQIITLS